jgi:hypothetical protein
MERGVSSSFFAYAVFLTLIGSVFSMAFPIQASFATHSDIEEVEVSDTKPEPSDDITISGIIDGAQEDDDVDITIHEPGGGSDTADTTVDSDDGDFSESYSILSGADDGVYQVEVEYGSEDPMYAYFLIDEEPDDADVVTDEDSYEPGQTVEIAGEVDDPELGEDEVSIIVLDPEGNDIGPGDRSMESDGSFDYDLDLENDAHPGTYGIIVEYAGDEVGWNIFEVIEESSSGDNEITASLEDSTLEPGDEVVISGSIDEDDVDLSEEVFLEIEDPDDAIVESDSKDPDPDTGEFEFSYTLEDDAELGTYTVTLQYFNYDDKTLTFTVSTDGGSGGSGSGSGSSSGLTARLSKTSLLAGETITVSGVVPRITDDPVNISILRPDSTFIVASFPEPDSDKSYSSTLRLPSSLEEDEDYTVIVSYDGKEVELSFDITGTASGSDGGPITVETDKASYASGSTVEISGQIADDTFVPGNQIALQVLNPDRSPYRFDPITPESDGSYSYSLVVGGPLGVTGEWEVKVTYRGQTAETNFDLTGGAPSKPRFNLVFEDMTFPIEYETDGSITSMYVRPAEKKLVISINDNEDGTLTIKLPRQVIDAVEGGSDIKYIVSTLDTQTGEERQIDITESLTTSDSRTIVIDYGAGTDLIEIQGTTIIPEFGPLSAVVLALSVIAAITVSARLGGRLGAYKRQ